MKILVLTTEAVTASQLRDALPSGAGDPEDAEVMVVAPALHKNALRFWVSDADEAIAEADEVRRDAVRAARRRRGRGQRRHRRRRSRRARSRMR